MSSTSDKTRFPETPHPKSSPYGASERFEIFGLQRITIPRWRNPLVDQLGTAL
jgi:hypothetical protein